MATLLREQPQEDITINQNHEYGKEKDTSGRMQYCEVWLTLHYRIREKMESILRSVSSREEALSKFRIAALIMKATEERWSVKEDESQSWTTKSTQDGNVNKGEVSEGVFLPAGKIVMKLWMVSKIR